jgi:hypothetical protein
MALPVSRPSIAQAEPPSYKTPADAAVSDMPTHALELVEADYQVRADGLAPLLVGLVKSDIDLSAIRHEVPLETI